MPCPSRTADGSFNSDWPYPVAEMATFMSTPACLAAVRWQVGVRVHLHAYSVDTVLLHRQGQRGGVHGAERQARVQISDLEPDVFRREGETLGCRGGRRRLAVTERREVVTPAASSVWPAGCTGAGADHGPGGAEHVGVRLGTPLRPAHAPGDRIPCCCMYRSPRKRRRDSAMMPNTPSATSFWRTPRYPLGPRCRRRSPAAVCGRRRLRPRWPRPPGPEPPWGGPDIPTRRPP